MKKKATRTVPLAPPAPLGPAPPDLRQSKQKGASKKFNWTGWLSPRAPRPRPGVRSQSDDDGEGGARMARPRRTSFDHSGVAPSARPRVKLNVERGGAGYFGGSSSSFGKSAGSEGASSLLASKSADEAFDSPAGGGGVGHRNPRASLLTACTRAESAAIGAPDPVNMEVVKAFVVLKPGHEPSDDPELSIMNTIRKRLSPLAMPQAIEFTDSLPRTRSGKIMRRLLKAREWGEPIGDISTLEND